MTAGTCSPFELSRGGPGRGLRADQRGAIMVNAANMGNFLAAALF
jgi:hypothetical protein